MTESDLSTVGTWSYGLAAAGFAAFAVRLALGWRPGVRAVLLLVATAITAVWALAGAVVAYRPGYNVWFGFTALDALRYAGWFGFLAILSKGAPDDGTARSGRRWLGTALLAIAILAALALPYAPPGLTVVDPAIRTLGLALRLALAVLGLFLIEQALRRAIPSARWALKPLCVGLGGVFGFDLFLFADAMLFGQLDPQIWIARGAANALVIPFIAVATARNPTWTIEMHVSRGAVRQSTAVLLSGVFLFLVAGAGYLARFLGGEWGRALQIEVSFFALLVGVLVLSSGKFRSRLRVFVSKHFFSYRYDYREEWLRFTHTLSDATRARDVEERGIAAIANLVESPAGALWLQEGDAGYLPAKSWNLPPITAVEPATGSLARFLARTAWVIDLSEYAEDRARYADLELPDWLAEKIPSARLVVPLTTESGLVGFVILSTPRATIELNWEVRDLLKAASTQAASYLGQVRATEALVEARKFDAFNRMSAFVVHDLKNLVAQLSLMLKNAERHRENPEFQRDMLSTVEHVVDRMNQLMLQLRTGAEPVASPRLTKVDAVIRSVCKSLGDVHVAIDLDLAPGVSALAHEDRLDHVIGHLLQNAIDATESGGRVSVRLYREEGFAVVEVTDKGVGMTSEFVRERLFKPFETNKPMGMGIGVYESAQYVRSLGGEIHFESAPAAGTRVQLRLPAGDGAIPPPRAEALA